MKVFASTHDFDYSWEEVSTANWRKYCPWNKESTHVIAVDTLSRSLDRETGVVCDTFFPLPLPLPLSNHFEQATILTLSCYFHFELL